jgi:hypothetical protein
MRKNSSEQIASGPDSGATAGQPRVRFENSENARALTAKEVDEKLAKGARISNTARQAHELRKKRPTSKDAAAAPREAAAAQDDAAAAPGPARGSTQQAKACSCGSASTAAQPVPADAVQASNPGLERSDESAVGINPSNPMNIVAGAATFDGKQFDNSAYVSFDGGFNWKTVTALSDTDEGAAIAFDDFNTCYYATMQGGFFPCCVMSTDGGLTWSKPAPFGFGDKTAVAARGRVALVGFDRLNTEACAFTLDGGATWTVHDFKDSGLGTAPLVSYDLQWFYLIYGALDGNIKMFASPDRGVTWSGPSIVVAGNAFESPIAGPLSYQGDALTCPGTNVAIDESGALHLLYIDSKTSLPMYTSSANHGLTWSIPVNVDPSRAAVPHMFPCLSCDKQGHLLAGSLMFDAQSGKYLILRHVKCGDTWETSESDSGPWSAAPAPPGFRIGFGDYFDCDSTPECGPSVMAWSESPTGKEPWQTWARVLEPVCGPCCPTDECACQSPCAPPWLSYCRCIPFFEERIVTDPNPVLASPNTEFGRGARLQFLLVFEHCLELLGRQQGPLLFTTTLLPGEKQRLYHFDRYRRIRATEDTFSVHTSFRQYVSALHTSHVTQSAGAYVSSLSTVRKSGDASLGVGGLLGAIGGLFGIGGGGSVSESSSTTGFASVSVQKVSEDFNQVASAASLAVDAERSTVVSTFEEKDTEDITSRDIQNDNACYAVTYFVRKVLEAYCVSTRLVSISWRLVDATSTVSNSPWRAIGDFQGVPQAVVDRIVADLKLLPQIGATIGAPRPIALPTDGTLYEAELAHCSSCEPNREALERCVLDKACAEAELVALEVKRRKLRLEQGLLDPFENPPAAQG